MSVDNSGIYCRLIVLDCFGAGGMMILRMWNTEIFSILVCLFQFMDLCKGNCFAISIGSENGICIVPSLAFLLCNLTVSLPAAGYWL